MKKIIPVIHLIDTDQVFQNVEICISLNVNQVFLINHITDHIDLLKTALLVKEKFPNLWIGLNFLDLHPSVVLKMDLPFNALWFDKTLSTEDLDGQNFKGEVFSGLNFKYQKQFYGSFLEDAINTIKLTSTVACTSGDGTGISASINKIKELKQLLGDFPMALASGVTKDNIKDYLPYVDNFLVASSITNHKEMIQKELLQELMDEFKSV